MLTGSRFAIAEATIALEAINSTRTVIITVPQGAIIEVAADTSGQGSGIVDVLWEGRALAMFAVDVETRGTEVAQATSQSACA
jgi:hypothetical protein